MDFLPAGFESLILHPNRGTIGATEEALGESEGLAIYIVDRFATIKKASEWYELTTSLAIFTSGLKDPSDVSPVQDFKSETADEYQVTCGYFTSDLRCVFEARYQEYYVFFSGSLGEGRFSPDGFLDVIFYIDQKFGKLLEVKQ
ncbi:MAG: hypothetical protein HY258_09925 [Chloroflexi bacterium]|nr:hypothetical protein [Chloroflexota bacterium]